MDKIVITLEEQKAIASLERLAKKWPSSLSLVSNNGVLCVWKTDAAELPVDITSIPGINNDGGDPAAYEDYLLANQFDIEYEEK